MPAHPPEALQLVALVLDQVRVTDSPVTIRSASTERVVRTFAAPSLLPQPVRTENPTKNMSRLEASTKCNMTRLKGNTSATRAIDI